MLDGQALRSSTQTLSVVGPFVEGESSATLRDERRSGVIAVRIAGGSKPASIGQLLRPATSSPSNRRADRPTARSSAATWRLDDTGEAVVGGPARSSGDLVSARTRPARASSGEPAEATFGATAPSFGRHGDHLADGARAHHSHGRPSPAPSAGHQRRVTTPAAHFATTRSSTCRRRRVHVGDGDRQHGRAATTSPAASVAIRRSSTGTGPSTGNIVVEAGSAIEHPRRRGTRPSSTSPSRVTAHAAVAIDVARPAELAGNRACGPGAPTSSSWTGRPGGRRERDLPRRGRADRIGPDRSGTEGCRSGPGGPDGTPRVRCRPGFAKRPGTGSHA